MCEYVCAYADVNVDVYVGVDVCVDVYICIYIYIDKHACRCSGRAFGFLCQRGFLEMLSGSKRDEGRSALLPGHSALQRAPC